MGKSIKKKILYFILSILLLLPTIPFSVVSAAPANNVSISGITLNNGQYLQNGVVTNVAPSTGGYAYFVTDGTTSTLTLNNFSIISTTPIAVTTSGDINIDLIGTNNIVGLSGSAESKGIFINSGGVTITGSGNLSVAGGDVNGTNVASYGIHANFIRINATGEVSAFGSSATKESFGLFSDNIEINNGIVKVVGGTVPAGKPSYGILTYASPKIVNCSLDASGNTGAISFTSYNFVNFWYMWRSNAVNSVPTTEYYLSGELSYSIASATAVKYLQLRKANKMAEPSFNLTTPGTYNTTRNVGIVSNVSPVTIRYTTDGSDPTSSSAVYTAPISLAMNTGTIIKAKSFSNDPNILDSDIITGEYIISTSPSIQVRGKFMYHNQYLANGSDTPTLVAPLPGIGYAHYSSDGTNNVLTLNNAIINQTANVPISRGIYFNSLEKILQLILLVIIKYLPLRALH